MVLLWRVKTQIINNNKKEQLLDNWKREPTRWRKMIDIPCTWRRKTELVDGGDWPECIRTTLDLRSGMPPPTLFVASAPAAHRQQHHLLGHLPAPPAWSSASASTPTPTRGPLLPRRRLHAPRPYCSAAACGLVKDCSCAPGQLPLIRSFWLGAPGAANLLEFQSDCL